MLDVEAGPGVVGVLKARNSLVGDWRSGFEVVVVVVDVDVGVGISWPLMLASIRGSIDLRLLWPPRGMVDVSIA